MYTLDALSPPSERASLVALCPERPSYCTAARALGCPSCAVKHPSKSFDCRNVATEDPCLAACCSHRRRPSNHFCAKMRLPMARPTICAHDPALQQSPRSQASLGTPGGRRARASTIPPTPGPIRPPPSRPWTCIAIRQGRSGSSCRTQHDTAVACSPQTIVLRLRSCAASTVVTWRAPRLRASPAGRPSPSRPRRGTPRWAAGRCSAPRGARGRPEAGTAARLALPHSLAAPRAAVARSTSRNRPSRRPGG
mmetsp:Transcript_6073/g.15047  ORF Transcript_6073/g.15047 Transcript_6073/m.15047 type:complete len:252 (+) Transcript_6073:705-1460(+)